MRIKGIDLHDCFKHLSSMSLHATRILIECKNEIVNQILRLKVIALKVLT